MAETRQKGAGEGNSMFGLLLPVLLALVLALVLNAFSEVPPSAPDAPSSAPRTSDKPVNGPDWPGKPPAAGVEKGNRGSSEAALSRGAGL